MRSHRLIPAVLALLTAPVFAQGIVLERRFDPESVRRPDRQPREVLVDRTQRRTVFLRSHRVDVTIDGRVAKTEIEQIFFNPHNVQLEGVYLFPLPASASLSHFTMRMAGKDIPGEVLDHNRAREIYRSIVHRRRDPGLLEFAGRGVIRARLFPIPARGETRITLRYEQILDSAGGTVEYVYPMKSDNFAPGPVKTSGRFRIRSKAGVDAVFSSTHKLDVVRRGDAVEASFEESRSAADRELRVLFTEGHRGVGMLLSTHKPKGEDGTFLMVLEPKTGFEDAKVLPKDIVFVIDTSGSMGDRGGKKMKQAKAAIRYALGRLHPEDRFNVISFATAARSFRDGIVKATDDNRAAALAYVDKLEATGGTAIHEALTEALKVPRESGRVPLVFFLTDGQPTIGLADPDALGNAVTASNRAKARVFVFGVGDDVNTHLLADIAERNGGSGHYVADNENIEIKLSALYDKVASPVMTDVTIAMDDVGEYDVYPRRIGDLFKGQQLVLAGRYTGKGPRAVKLKGKIGDRDVTFVYEGTFGTDGGRDDLARLWAVKKVAHLMDSVRRHGAKSELVDEIRLLGVRYGIVTPYTSYLVVEEGEMARRNMRRRGRPAGAPADGAIASAAKRIREELDSAAEAADRGDSTGRGAAAGARMTERLRSGGIGGGGGSFAGDREDRKVVGVGIRRLGGKSFRYAKGIWVQQNMDLPAKYETKTVVFLSDEYDALSKDATIARWLAAGTQVTFFHDGVLYRVVEATK